MNWTAPLHLIHTHGYKGTVHKHGIVNLVERANSTQTFPPSWDAFWTELALREAWLSQWYQPPPVCTSVY